MDVTGGEIPAMTPPTAGRPQVRSLALNSSAVFLISVVIQFAGYVSTFFLVRGPGHTLAGIPLLGTILTFFLFASSVSNLGDLRIGSAYTFFISRGQPPSATTVTYLGIRFVLVALAGLALFAVAPAAGLSTPATLEIFGVWMILPILWTPGTIYQGLWVSLGDSVRSQVPLLVESIIRSATLTVVAIHLIGVHNRGLDDPTGTMWMITLPYVLGAAASCVVSIPTIVRFRGPFDVSEARRMLRWAWPLMVSMILLYLSGNLIQLVVVRLGPTPFAIFMAANAFRVLILSLPVAIALPLFPQISSLHAQRQYHLIRSRTWQALRYTAILVVPAALVLTVYRVNVLYIFYQPSYLSGNVALGILALSAIPAALSQIIGTTLTAIGRTRLELYITALQVGSLVLTAAIIVEPVGILDVLGPEGIDGAATAVLLSSVAALALNTYFMTKLMGVRIELRPIGTIFLSALASFVALSRLNQFLPINRYYQLAAGFLLGFGVYALVLAGLGELTKEDVIRTSGALGIPTPVGALFARLCWKKEARGINDLPSIGPETLDAVGAPGNRPGAPPP